MSAVKGAQEPAALASSVDRWPDKFKVLDETSSTGGRLQVFDFSQPQPLTEADLLAIEAAEKAELEARRQHEQKAADNGEAALKTSSAMPTVLLSSGTPMPLIGLGTWKSEKGKVREAVAAALQAGYRHIDCATVYGNEGEVGEALTASLATRKLVRGDIFITSKLWNSSHAADKVRTACTQSLKSLQTPYLDLYLMHWPATGKPGLAVDPPLPETWAAMEALVDEGLVKAIGVSNFSIQNLELIMASARLMPAVCQVECHPYFRNDRLLAWCRVKGIHVTAYSPLGSPDSADMFKRSAPKLLEDSTVKRVAAEVGRDPGQVLIKWALQRGTSVLPKSTSANRIASNLDVLSWELPEDAFKSLSSLDVNTRMVDGAFLLHPKGPYRTLPELWDEAGTLYDEADKNFKSAAHGTRFGPHPMSAPLNNGTHMPLVGLGTWKSKKGEIRAAVEAALRMGYRHIDCAAIYGNESEVGEALAAAINEGTVKREDVWVTSKLWNDAHAATDVGPALKKSLTNLRLDYLDLYLIHWPATGKAGDEVQPSIRLVQETWHALEGCVEAGLVRTIGLSNFSAPKIAAVLSYARIPPAVVQVEVHPYFRNDDLIQWCGAHDIHVTAYAPLGSPDSAAMFKRQAPSPMDDPVVQCVAIKLEKTPAQVLIRWALQHGTSVLAKSVNSDRLAANFDVVHWGIPVRDYKELCQLKTQVRMLDGAFLCNPKGPYRTVADLWDEHDDAKTAPVKMALPRKAPEASVRKFAVNPMAALLNMGAEMPLIALAVEKAAPGEVRAAVEAGLHADYRHIDATLDCDIEGELGEALAKAFHEGLVKRDDIWVTTKVASAVQEASALEPSVKQMLVNLKLDQFDLLLITNPSQDTWQAMEGCVEAGLVRAIGLHGCSVEEVETVVAYTRIPPAVVQVEAHPYNRNDALLAWCTAHGIHVMACAPLGPADGSVLGPLANPLVLRLAEKHSKTPAQVLIRWGLQRGMSVVPAHATEDDITANIGVIDFGFANADYQQLSSLTSELA